MIILVIGRADLNCNDFHLNSKRKPVSLIFVNFGEWMRLIMEMEAVKQEYASLESQLVSLKKQIDELASEVDSQKAKIASMKDGHKLAQSELYSARLKIKECDSLISSILKEQQQLQNNISETNLEKKRMENEVKRMEMDQKDCSLKVEKLIEKHAWIASEKQLFGRNGVLFEAFVHGSGK